MSGLARFYGVVARTAVQTQFQYRTANYLYLIGMVAEPLVYLVVWQTVARAQGGAVEGITAEEFAAYHIVWTLVRNRNIVFTPYGWEERIQRGELSGALVRPVHPIHYDLAYVAAWKVVVIVLWLPIAAVLALLFHPTFDVSPLEVLVFLCAIWGAYLIRSLLLWVLGMVTFWTTRVGALYQIWFTAELLLSGRLLPLALLPAWAGTVAAASPFPSTFGYPIDVLAGDLSTAPCSPGWRCRGCGSRSVPPWSPSSGGSASGGSRRWWVMARRGGPRGGVVGTFVRVAVQHELQYRVNFVLSLVQSLVSVGTSLAVLALVFLHTESLRGWRGDELVVVMGVFVLMGGVIRAVIQPNMQQLMVDVQQGTLDGLLTKPADSQLLISARRFDVWQGVDVPVGLALAVVGLVRLGRPVDVLAVATFALTLVLGAVALYCVWLLLTVTACCIVRVDVLVELFDGLYQAGRWPVGSYPGWLRFAFAFLLPLAFAITVPAAALTRGVPGWVLLGAVAFTAVLFTVTRLTWRYALRHYTGASA